MRIAQIAAPIERIPPKKYGGTERVIYNLTEELVARGHDVTLFASEDSKTSAKLISVFPKGLRETYPNNLTKRVTTSLLHLGNAYQMQDQFDVIHDHTSLFGVAFAQLSKTPVVMTLHGPITKQSKQIYDFFRNPYLVNISKSQIKPAPNLNYIGHVYNGLNMSSYPFSITNNGYLLFVGRITKEKGVHIAIKIAQKAKLPLIIAAKLEEQNRGYFEREVKPYLSDKIRWIGEVSEEKRNHLMSKALCFLHPLTWREPFGLTLIESMATGCPVIAFNKGSMPEIIKHGKTGYIAKDINQFAEYIKKVDKIDRNYCREYALSTFSAQRMADGYEAIYYKILSKSVSIYNKPFPYIID